MCGLVGFIGQPSKVNRQIFRDMLCLDTRRGPHSTGVAVASKNDAYMLKSTRLPWDLAAEPSFQEHIMDKNWPVMMGHNRFATIGTISEENAHPFWHGHIILSHNGTLTGLHRLDDQIKYDTDSEVFAYNVYKNGIEDTYAKTGGALTAVWWDQKANNLNVITNGQRPFCFALSENKRTMYYASEEWMFRLACEARGVKLEKDYYTLKVDHLFSFFQTRKGIIDYTSKELKPFISEFGYGGSTYDPKTGTTSYGVGWDANIDDENEEAWNTYAGDNYTGAKDKNVDLKAQSHKKKPKGKDSFTAEDRAYGLVKDVIPNEETYKARFGDIPCILCGEDMMDAHKTALLIDCETIACADCSDLCKQHHIELT